MRFFSIFVLILACITLHTSFTADTTSGNNNNDNNSKQIFNVPNIVHQIYDYQYPTFFLYLSIQCTQTFIKPDKHILWINDEGRYRRGHWETWYGAALHDLENNNNTATTWLTKLAKLVELKKIETRFLTFPAHPPGNETILVTNKAHRSDFLRLKALYEEGGIYLDTDAFPIKSLDNLRLHNFTIGYDNVITNPIQNLPYRLNNGILLSAPKAEFINVWSSMYNDFNPDVWDYHSSIIPFKLAMNYPDLVEVEMSRISPMSYAFQTSEAAAILTCGIYLKDMSAIYHPRWDDSSNKYIYDDSVLPDKYVYNALHEKYIYHLTMSAVRGVCMLRKLLSDPQDLKNMPSLLGSIFRQVYYGYDDYDYAKLISSSHEEKMNSWNTCRTFFGMHGTPDALINFGGSNVGVDDKSSKKEPYLRQQYIETNNP